MGLDQNIYLRRRIKIDGVKTHSLGSLEGNYYFRKCNQLNAFFEKYVEVENCEPVVIPKNAFTEGIDTIELILAQDNPDDKLRLAETLFPTQAGFFFGSTLYGEWYFEDLAHLLKVFKEIVQMFEEKEDLCAIYVADW